MSGLGRGMDPQRPVAEVRLGPTISPRSVKFWWARGWRWDVVFQRPMVGDHSGVYDRREHLVHHSGYSFTAWGAALAIGRVVRRGHP